MTPHTECYSRTRLGWPGRFYRIAVYPDGSWSYPDGLPWADANAMTPPKTIKSYLKIHGYARYYGLAINGTVLPPPTTVDT